MRRILLLAVGGLSASACTDLPAIAAGTCGNAVVELAAGEDCDAFATTDGSVCLPPGDPRQCRYDCSVREDGSRPTCPASMGCGLDGTCRWSSGGFEATPTPLAAVPRDLTVGDVDGDGRQDLIIAERERTVVRYFGDRAEPSAALEIPSVNENGTLPVTAELSGDSLVDIVGPYGGGIVTALGAATRALVPTAYPSVVLPADVVDAYYLSAEVLPQVPDQEAMLLASTAALPIGSLVYVSQTLGTKQITATFPPSALAGDIAAGNIDEDPDDSPCDELVLPFTGQPTVFVFSPCKRDPADGIVLNINGVPFEIHLPAGDSVFGKALLADLDHDGHLDVSVVARNGNEHFIDRAYGLGDGTFHSQSPVPALGDSMAARVASIEGRTPLALGDLNGDGTPDFVDSDGIYLHRAAGWEIVATSDGSPWAEAVIADLNDNGIPDVLAVPTAEPGALFFNGAGDGYLSSWVVASEGTLSHLGVGDFDGDLVQDVAASESSPSDLDFMSVMFGRPVGAPEAARHMGLVDAIREIAPARATPEGKPVSAVDDVVSVSLAGDKRILFAGFGGRTDRNLRSPYILVSSSGSGAGGVDFVGYSPRALAAGRFDGDDHADLAVLGITGVGAPKSELRLWLVRMTDQAYIRPSDARSSDPLPEDADFTRGEMVSADLDHDGLDELVLLAPATSGSGSLAFVARSIDAGEGFRTWKLDAPRTLEQHFEHREALDTKADETARKLRSADVDADGNPDLLVLDAAGELLLLPGDGQGGVGAPLTLPSPPGGPVTQFIPLQADHDAALEIALLSGSRVYLADRRSDGTFYIRATPIIERAGALMLAAGDLDGDGVMDISVGTLTDVGVFRGVPGIR